MTKEFILPLRIYYEDTDAGGVVYHANYLKFMERARTELLREIGFDISDLAKQGYFFVVKNINLEYLYPARLNDYVEIVSKVAEHNKIKIKFQQQVRLRDNYDIVFCKSLITIVCVDEHIKPRKIRDDLLEILTNGN